MIGLTSPTLGMELYKLTDWEPPFFSMQGGKFIQAQYDLGYLLRKLLVVSGIDLFTGGDESKVYAVASSLSTDEQSPFGAGDTPEDAACKLVIKLINESLWKD